MFMLRDADIEQRGHISRDCVDFNEHVITNKIRSIFSALTIGTSVIHSPWSFFDGCLDSISYIARAKSANEILDGATLVANIRFDGNTLLDSGSLGINGTGSTFSYTGSGRVNQGLSLTGSSSYVQITGLRRLGISNWPYSFSIWINPTSTVGGSIMHLSAQTNGLGWCVTMLGFTSAGQITAVTWSGAHVFVNGPTAPLNTWTHIASTYSPTNGLRLYVNGVLQSSTGATSFAAANALMTATLGNSLQGLACAAGNIQKAQYSGSLDEFRVYARELSASEVVALANP